MAARIALPKKSLRCAVLRNKVMGIMHSGGVMQTHRILIVADDPDQSMLFSLVLTKAGYDIIAVADGASALAALDAGGIDLILTDYMLPDINGDAIICAIQQRALPVKTILMSNHIDVRSLARACTADGYYRKDDIHHLLAEVAALLPPPNGTRLTA